MLVREMEEEDRAGESRKRMPKRFIERGMEELYFVCVRGGFQYPSYGFTGSVQRGGGSTSILRCDSAGGSM